jgi:hypothetical protein
MFYYASALTPVLTSVAAPSHPHGLASIDGPGTLVLNGTGIGYNASDYSITLDGAPCLINTLNVDEFGQGNITCDLPMLYAGTKRLRVNIAGRGDAAMPASLAVLLASPSALRAPPLPSELLVGYTLRMSAAQPSKGSFWGGSTVNITGWGLAATSAGGAPAAPGGAFTRASVAGPTPAGSPMAAALVAASGAGWAAVSIGRVATLAMTPSTFVLTLSLQVVDSTWGDILGSATIVHTLDKANSPAVGAVNVTAGGGGGGSDRVTLTWNVALGTNSTEAADAGGAVWAAPGGNGSASAAAVAFQARAGAVAGPLVQCAGPVAVEGFLNGTDYEENLECDLPAGLPAANYTAWGELCFRDVFDLLWQCVIASQSLAVASDSC